MHVQQEKNRDYSAEVVISQSFMAIKDYIIIIILSTERLLHIFKV